MFATIPVSELFEKQQEKFKRQENRLEQNLECFPAEKIKLYERFRSGMVKQDVFLKEKGQLSRQEDAVRREIEKSPNRLICRRKGEKTIGVLRNLWKGMKRTKH